MIIKVKVNTGKKENKYIGMHDDAIRLYISARRIEGKANKELLKWLGDKLGSSVEISSGHNSSIKYLKIDKDFSREEIICLLEN